MPAGSIARRRGASPPQPIQPPSQIPSPPPTTPQPLLPAPPPNTPKDGPVLDATPRRQPLLLSRAGTRVAGGGKSKGARCAEVAGGAAADCAAVCCCCPCGLLHLAVLALVKLPAGLCRRAIASRKTKMKMKKRKRKQLAGSATTKGLLLDPKIAAAADEYDDGDDDVIVGVVHRGGGGGGESVVGKVAMGWPAAERLPSAEVSEMEKQMWARFHGAGFWRSGSQREIM